MKEKKQKKKMRPGGGAPKGSQYEREICYRLSKWISDNLRDDLFSRTVLSGGQFTKSGKKSKRRGKPGDITSSDPMAHDFASRVVVECKHWKNLNLFAFFTEKGDLFDALLKVRSEAEITNKAWLFITRQNFRADLVMFSADIFSSDTFYRPTIGMLQIHFNFGNIFIAPLELFLRQNNSKTFTLRLEHSGYGQEEKLPIRA